MRRGTSVSGTVAWPASSTNTCVNAWLESGRVLFFASDAVGVANESARNPALAHDATTTRAWSAASASEPLAAQNRETSDFTEAGSRRGSFTRTIVQSRSASALGVSRFSFAYFFRVEETKGSSAGGGASSPSPAAAFSRKSDEKSRRSSAVRSARRAHATSAAKGAGAHTRTRASG